MQPSRPRIFYGWVIVAASFLVMFCTIGIVNNCAGLFIKPVCDDMGFSRGGMGVNMTIIAACQMVMALFGGKIFARFDVKTVMRVSSLLLAGGYFAYSLAPSLPVFYLLSVVIGFSMGGLTTLPLSLLIGNWFHQRRGFAVGVAFMGSGIGRAAAHRPGLAGYIPHPGHHRLCGLGAGLLAGHPHQAGG